jgi:exopolysaccharide production protein ExoQ
MFIEALIVAACYLAFFANMNGVSGIVRPVIFALLFGAAFLSVATHKLHRIAPTPAELLLYLVGLLSAVVSFSRSEDYCIYYTMYYVAIIIFISVFTRTFSLERLLDLGAVMTILCIATCLLLQGRSYIVALEISMGPNGLLRYSPFNNHPLLMGYIFGSGSLLLARRVYLARTRWERNFMAVAVLLSWSMVLAASSRSTIVALMAAAAVAALLEFRALRAMTGKGVAVAAAVIGVLAVGYFGFAGQYLIKILEVDSSYRGLDTGATGRTDLWAKGMEALLSDPWLIAFGGGLRSSEYSVIGFLTENSYLTILLDSGLIVGGALILFLAYSPIAALRRQRSAGAEQKKTLAFLPSYFVFLLIQCFFLRYFIGIGNPTSLLTLIFFVSLSMYAAFQSSPALAPRAPAGASKASNAAVRVKT